MVVRLIVQTLVSFGIMGLLLFLAAGTADWLAAWVFLVEMIVLSIVGGLWLIRHDPALVQERLAPPIQKGQPTADKVLLPVIILEISGAIVLMALDAVRFAWSSVPFWVQAVRIQIEEKELRAGLKGYEDYARRVRYRLIPLIW
jgi:protein-S-isoprenylcysteine O-methyltransferase Ste14